MDRVRRRFAALTLALAAIAVAAWFALPRGSSAVAPVANAPGSAPTPFAPAAPTSRGSAAVRAPASAVAVAHGGSEDGPHWERPADREHHRKVADAVDPCEQPSPPEIPDGYQTLTAAGVTVAWDPEVTIEPTTLAFTTAGILAQIGIITDTAPRAEVAVIVYPSLDDFRAKTGSPEWSDGVYDGGAVRIPAVRGTDFGVAVHTLRHELVHAQLHVTIGCMPIWLNEGVAQFFANTPQTNAWLHMLKGKPPIEPGDMQVATVDEVKAEPLDVYAQSLAMVLYMFARGDSLADVVHDRRGPWMDLWARRYATASEHDVLDAVARRVFGIAQGPELETLLAGDVCCHGFNNLAELGCHAPPREKNETCRAAK